mmetsp:Transcript_117005/g.331517  ORF Transcript_117005/g.331517 Transcript_117005/m.331517 type:complete len:142 (+) Transcript_117005:69-494(+)
MASPQLIWECVKDTHCFMRKNKRMPVMTTEPGNLTGLHAFKYSGLANKQTFGLSPVIKKKKESIIMTQNTAKASRARRPLSMSIETGVNKCEKKGLAQLQSAMLGKYYRRDLLELAERKYKKIKTSFKKRKITVKSRRSKK